MKTQTIPRAARFESGVLVITPGAVGSVNQDDILTALVRHFGGDWGDLDEFDWKQNDAAAEYGGRILSQYDSAERTKFWIVTEADRSVTTVLLPAEY